MADQEEPAPLKSVNSNDPTYIVFTNKSNGNAEAWWLNFTGNPVSYADIKPDKTLKMNTYLMYSLQENCVRLILKMVRKEDICKLEIPQYLIQDISCTPNLLKEIQILSEQRSMNGSV